MRWADRPMTAWFLGAIALGLAAASAKPYAGSWNDGCRLAAVESLLDRGTLAIDDSVFCGTPQRLLENGHLPYPPNRYDLHVVGTLDKLYVNGHFHSDKPAVISILMAAVYRPLMWLGLPSPGERPDVFARVMTVLTSGLAYALAVGCLWILGGRIGLVGRWRLAWIAGFALSTFALTYTQHVNSNMMQLGVVAAMCVVMLRIAESDRTPWGSLVLLGTLAGLGFNLDFGSGPPLVTFVFCAVWWRTGRVAPVAAFTLAVLPWIAAGVGINYAISGKWLPMNMYPEVFRYPGSPFTEENLTGFARHEPLNQILYGLSLLFGKQGFWNHNLPLLLAVAAGWRIIRSRFPARGELVALIGWCTATWLMYAVLSNNWGGGCCSIRWFLPFLAPGFWILGVLLRDWPELRADYLILCIGGAGLSAIMWVTGPWTVFMVPGMWYVVGATLLAWGTIAALRARAIRIGLLDEWIENPVRAVLKLRSGRAMSA